MDFHLNNLLLRLNHYQLNGSFDKTFVPEKQGRYIKSIKVYDDNVKVKVKRDLFIMFHEDGQSYLVDSLETNKDILISTKQGKVKGLRLYNWKGLPNRVHLNRLSRYLGNPHTLIALALSISDPTLVCKVGKSLVGVKESDVKELRQLGANIVFAAKERKELQPVIKCRK